MYFALKQLHINEKYMSIDLSFIFFCGIVITGIIAAIDMYFVNKQLVPNLLNQQRPFLAEQSRSLFFIFLIVFIFRTFVVDHYQVPSSSLEPTLLPGDYVLINQFKFGIRLPTWKKKLFAINEPNNGDIVVLKWPVNESVHFIKRVVGVPGDKISYINKVLYINNKMARQTTVHEDPNTHIIKKEENLNGIHHFIYINPAIPTQNFYNLAVPQGQYFVMGDNRDDSDDSRFWGFVPEENIVGKGFMVWLSWSSLTHHIRFERIGKFI